MTGVQTCALPIFLETHPRIFCCLALATAKASSGTSLVMVEPAAIYEPFLTVTGAIRLVLHPIKASSSIVVLNLLDVYKRQFLYRIFC